MLTEEEIHNLFYENGRIKDRKDPSKRVLAKVYYPSKYISSTTLEKYSEPEKQIHIVHGMPYIANIAYCQYNFVQAIDVWRKITNDTLISQFDSKVFQRAKNYIFSMVGYLIALRQILEKGGTPPLLCSQIFTFSNYLNILSRCGIKYEDSKVVSRSRNLLKIISKSLGYDKSSKISIEKLKYEIEEQLTFFTESIEIFSQANDEDFVIYLLRYDLKKIKE